MHRSAETSETGARTFRVSGLRAYAAICLGQLVSLTGSGLSGFVLGVWTYQKTNSMAKFGFVLFCSILPTVLILPAAGVVVDRVDRRKVMMFSDATASLVSLSLALLLFAGKLQPWHIYPSTAALSALNAFRYLSFTSIVTVLVERKQYGRSIGMMQLAEAASLIIAPGLAGLLIVTISMSKILLIDFSTFLFSLVMLMIVDVPRAATAPAFDAKKPPVLEELTFGWRYIAARPGLFVLMVLFLLSNFNTGVWEVLISPLLLRLSSPAVLGTVLSIRSVGILAATLIMSVLAVGQRRILLVVIFSLVQGLSLVLGGFHISVLAVAAAAIVISFSFPIINNCSQCIWQSKVPGDVQGRVFATRRMFTLISVPAAYVVAGGVAERFFEPLMSRNGALAASFGRVIGVGPNHGIALLFVLLGALMVMEVLGCTLHPRIRRLETEIPDAPHPREISGEQSELKLEQAEPVGRGPGASRSERTPDIEINAPLEISFD